MKNGELLEPTTTAPNLFQQFSLFTKKQFNPFKSILLVTLHFVVYIISNPVLHHKKHNFAKILEN